MMWFETKVRSRCRTSEARDRQNREPLSAYITGKVSYNATLFAQMTAWATARPATRPEKRQPPRNVPSNAR